MVGLGLAHGSHGGLQVWPRFQGNLPELVTGHELVAEIERPGHVKLIYVNSRVQECEQLDLCGFQVLPGSLQIRFILDALQFQPVEINLRNVAGIEAGSAYIEHVVVVGKVVFRQLEHRFRL